ncbi:MAG: hypothetical protein WC765_06525, partial [Phycisphaerae bacterium]
SEKCGWIFWTDRTYSLLYSNKYTGMKGRDNHRINLAFFSKIKKKIFVLEIHQELENELEPSLYDIIKNIVTERVRQAEEEFNLTYKFYA